MQLNKNIPERLQNASQLKAYYTLTWCCVT